jgi:hypothetical protein
MHSVLSLIQEKIILKMSSECTCKPDFLSELVPPTNQDQTSFGKAVPCNVKIIGLLTYGKAPEAMRPDSLIVAQAPHQSGNPL